MAVETKVWDAAEVLNTSADIAAYLDAYLEDGKARKIRSHRRLWRKCGFGEARL